jgi:hypothetical protein
VEGTENNMIDQRNLRYFLGGNTSHGFFSLFDSFISLSDSDFLWIIKGGPGCGKSSFMKMIAGKAERAGFSVEYAVCSGDPASLDGIYIPELKIAYIDGSSPHAADENLSAADCAYINLGAFYDREAINEFKTELKELNASLQAKNEKAFALFASAGKLRLGWQNSFSNESEKDAAIKRVSGITVKEFGKRHREKGKTKRRFLSAFTSDGLSAFSETAQTLCKRFYIFENRLQLGEMALEKVAEAAVNAGHEIIICPNPLTPEVMEAVLVPSLSLGFVTSDSALSHIPDTRRIRFDALVDSERLKLNKREIRRSEKLINALISEGISALSEARAINARIEEIYNSNFDSESVYSLVAEHILTLGIK